MPTPQSTEPETRRDPLREALSTGMADALTKDWPGDTRLQTAPAIVDYLLALPAVRAALASSTPDALDVEALAPRDPLPWADNAAAALDELDRLYYDGAGPTVAEYRAATDAVRTAIHALASSTPGALDADSEAMQMLLAPDLEHQARIDGVREFVEYAAEGFDGEDLTWLERAAERFAARGQK